MLTQPDALRRVGDRDVEEHDDQRTQVDLGARVERRATAERHHALAVEGVDHGGPLEVAEHRLAVLDEDVGDAASGPLDHDVVGVGERLVEQGGDQPADGRLAGAGRPDQHHAGRHHQVRRASGTFAR
ncbi:hypothetical protein GCM10025868_03700 [Angustibacter aerolatus]|uniref:Uncharacterized protein n=1 Tax=Angustibacter aerolatus TaxID=1162965 RepID=A0ABQ6JE69_9ACTN|nr:hypothetical protein GCM10025868_03700 [Angustibacter aerolatus]